MATLEGKVALVTAATGGIGRGIVEALLAEGASVVMTGRSAEKGAKALEEIGLRDRTAFLSGDARDWAEVAGWVAGVVEAFVRLDILVYNEAGREGLAVVHELSDEAWDIEFTFIVKSAVWDMRAA